MIVPPRHVALMSAASAVTFAIAGCASHAWNGPRTIAGPSGQTLCAMHHVPLITARAYRAREDASILMTSGGIRLLVAILTTFLRERRFAAVVSCLSRQSQFIIVLCVRGSLSRRPIGLNDAKSSNQPMKPTAPSRNNFTEFATTPCRGLSLSR